MRTTVFSIEDDPVRLSAAFHLVQFIVVQSRGNTPPCQNGSILHPLVSDVMSTLRCGESGLKHRGRGSSWKSQGTPASSFALSLASGTFTDMLLMCPRWKAMTNCTEQQYWDNLLCQCISCRVACNRPSVERCTTFCASMDCIKQPGSYYDELLRKCINCSGICGQHPIQCLPFCENKLVTTSSRMPALEQKLGNDQDQWLVVYLLLALCLCTVICSLLVGWTHFKRRGAEVSCQPAPGTCHKREDSSKDHLVEAGSVGGGSTGSRLPEPVETCGFCFPEQGPAMQETKACHSSFYHPGARATASQAGISSTGSAGAIPTPEDGHFKIICSPSQEKTPMT